MMARLVVSGVYAAAFAVSCVCAAFFDPRPSKLRRYLAPAPRVAFNLVVLMPAMEAAFSPWLLFDETLGGWALAGMVLAVAGVALVVNQGRQRTGR